MDYCAADLLGVVRSHVVRASHVDLGVGDTASLRELLSGEPYFSEVAAHEGIVSLGLRERHSGSLAPGRLPR